MEITSLPTDSIYKFSTFAGLLIMISSFVYFNDINQQAYIQDINITSDIAIDSLKFARLDERFKRLETESNRYAKELDERIAEREELYKKVKASKGKPRYSSLIKKYDAKSEEISILLEDKKYSILESKEDALDDLEFKTEIESEEIDRKLRLLKNLAEKITLYDRFYNIFMAAGLILFTLGSIQWMRMQLLLDKIIRKEAQ